MQNQNKNQSAKNFKYANKSGYSDVSPYEIVRVVSEKTLEVRPMHAELDPSWKPEWIQGGFAGHCVNQSSQRWSYSQKPDAPVFRIRLRKNGRWCDAYGNRFSLSNEPVMFYDYNF